MNRKAGVLGLVALIAALSGCSATKTTSSNSTLNSDQQAVNTTVASNPTIVDDGLFSTSDASGFSARGSASPLTGIGDQNTRGPIGGPSTVSPDRFFKRIITNVSTTANIDVTRDSSGAAVSAHVTVDKHLTGTFRIVTPAVGDTGSAHVVNKPLADHWTRQLWLTRSVTRDSSGAHGRWHIMAVSPVEVTSEVDDPGPQPHIVSVRVQFGSVDTTFTDPAAAITFHGLPRVPTGTQVTVTVTTQAADDIVVLMHHDGRVRLQANGDNTYTGVWNTSNFAGLKHIGINALSHATIYDDSAAYHSHAWLFPYLNEGDVMADETP